MARVSPEKLVRDKVGAKNARIESHKQNFGPRYYLVRLWDETNNSWRHMWTGEGKTKPAAWKDAAIRLGLIADNRRSDDRRDP